MRARTAFVGPSFEGGGSASGFAGPYVLPYDHGAFAAGCEAAGALRCPDGLPGYFLARLPVDELRPNATTRRFTFAAEADATVPAAWSDVTWDADPVRVLAFPEGRRLVVTAGLTAGALTLTEAEPGERWGGVAVYHPGSLTLDGVTVEHAEVGVDVNAVGNALTDVLLDGNGVGLHTGYACGPAGCGAGEPIRSDFALTESCVTNSVFDPLLDLDGYGIWARHTDGTVEASTVGQNDGYGLFLDDALVGAYHLLVAQNGFGSSGAPDGVNVRENGDLYLVTLNVTPPAGQNALTSNDVDELHVDLGGYAAVGVNGTSALRNHLALGSDATSTDDLVDNEPGNSNIPALKTYWGTGGAPPAGTIEGLVSVSNPLATSTALGAGHPDGCVGAGAALQGGGGSFAVASGPPAEAGADSTLGVLDPEAAAWFTEQVDSLRAALTAAPDSAGLVRALYAVQRLDRADALGEHAATMGLLAAIHARLVGGDTLTAAARAAGEAALVAAVHDALRAGRHGEAEGLMAPFVSDASPLPEIEGAGARHTLALALAALDEGAGDLPSALGRLAAVQAELGPEEGQTAGDLAATAALLERRLGEGGGVGLEGGTPDPATVAPAPDLPVAYALGAPYPNPTTGRATVPFALPHAARVALHVYDLLGRRVATLADGPFEPGRHAAVLDGRRLASGVYVVRAVMRPENGAAPRAFTRRVTLLR